MATNGNNVSQGDLLRYLSGDDGGLPLSAQASWESRWEPETTSGESYRERETVSPTVSIVGPTGRDRALPWNDTPVTPFANGLGAWREEKNVGGATPRTDTRGEARSSLGKNERYVGLNSLPTGERPLSPRRTNGKAHRTLPWTFGQGWVGTRVWSAVESLSEPFRLANDLVKWTAVASLVVKPESNEGRVISAINALRSERGFAPVQVQDRYAPNTSLPLRATGDESWVLDAPLLGSQPWFDGTWDSDMKTLRHDEFRFDRRVSGPWWDTHALEQAQGDNATGQFGSGSNRGIDNYSGTIRTNRRIVATASRDLALYSDSVSI